MMLAFFPMGLGSLSRHPTNGEAVRVAVKATQAKRPRRVHLAHCFVCALSTFKLILREEVIVDSAYFRAEDGNP